MIKKISIVCIVLFTTTIYAQEKTTENPSNWKKNGTVTFLFNQSAFKNWQAGGVNNIAGNLSLNYDFNYAKNNWTWDNKIIASYGLTKLKDQGTKKTDDRLEFNSLVGKKSKGFWYYSGFLNFKTQMSSTDVGGVQQSHFFSPAYLQFGPGMLWKKSNNLKINIAPATSKLVMVHSHFTENLAIGSSYFGVDPNKTTRYEFGVALNGYYKLELLKNVSMENILNLYSNYLDKPGNIDLDYTVNFVMKINKYMSTNVTIQAIYDDNAIKALQTKEVFGLGVNYIF